MQPDARGAAAASWRRVAVILWASLIVAVCVRGAIQQNTHSLYPTFAAAGAHWLDGTSLYYWAGTEPGLEPYRYSPLVAALLVPFDLLPSAAGSVAWRLLNAGVLLVGMAAWLRSPLPWQLSAVQRALMYLIVLPLALGSLNNGQANPLVVGLLLLTVAAAGAERWNLAAVAMALATALKVYPFALGLLLAAAYPRRFALRLALALVAVAALPFALQAPAYVSGQYAEWFRVLSEDERKFWPLHMAYRDLWLLFRVTHLPISPRIYQVIQVLSGGACAVVCVALRWRKFQAASVLTAVFTLGTCWMTLCGPATESSTFVLIAPALSLGLLAAKFEDWRAPLRWLPAMAAVLLSIGILAGLTRSTANIHSLGIQPLAALLLFTAYFAVYVRALRANSTRMLEAVPGPAQAA